MRAHPLLLGLLLVALAAAIFGYTFTFPAFPGQKYGPSLFPRVISVGIVLCALTLIWRGRSSGGPWLSVDPELRDTRRLVSLLSIPAAVVFYLLAAPRLGFLPTAAVLVAGLALWLGVRLWVALLAGVITSVVVHWFFASIMRVPLPRGWFMQIIAGG